MRRTLNIVWRLSCDRAAVSNRGNFVNSMLPHCYTVVNYYLFIRTCLLQCNNYIVVNHCKITFDLFNIGKDDGLSFKICFYNLIWSVVQNGSESCTLEKEHHKHIQGIYDSAWGIMLRISWKLSKTNF